MGYCRPVRARRATWRLGSLRSVFCTRVAQAAARCSSRPHGRLGSWRLTQEGVSRCESDAVSHRCRRGGYACLMPGRLRSRQGTAVRITQLREVELSLITRSLHSRPTTRSSERPAASQKVPRGAAPRSVATAHPCTAGCGSAKLTAGASAAHRNASSKIATRAITPRRPTWSGPHVQVRSRGLTIAPAFMSVRTLHHSAAR